jgi:shikimate dehydrogenase
VAGVVLPEPGRRVLNRRADRLEVWGDPIAHSRSPQLHSAAYSVLGYDWDYGRRRVEEASFADELNGLDSSWRGLSLTMPLKGAAFAAAAVKDRRAELTGAVNTLLLDTAGRHQGFNTDVGGIVRALADEGVSSLSTARIVGAGATATSALVALAELGAVRVEVVARRPAAVEALRELGGVLGVEVSPSLFEASEFEAVPLTIATLPGDAPLAGTAATSLARAGGLLFDVVYGHWPTRLSSAWDGSGSPAVSGLGMLLHQALLQVRVFAQGDVDVPLPDELAVLGAMRQALDTPG